MKQGPRKLLLFGRVNLLTLWPVLVWFLLRFSAHVTNVIFVPTKNFSSHVLCSPAKNLHFEDQEKFR